MKSVKVTLSIMSLGLLLSLGACNSNKNSEGGSTDSTSMDNTQTQMESDTMAADSAGSSM